MPIDYTRRFRPESAEWEQSRAINDILDELSTHNSTYARRIGQTVVLCGDSHTAFNGGTSIATPTQSLSTSYDSKGFFNWANVALRHAFRVIGNAGIGGQTSAQILARFGTDVLAYNPDWVVILAGTNSDGSAATTIANLTSMYSQASAAGIKVIAVTIPPNSSANLGIRQDFLTINRFIRDYCRANRGMVLADIGAALVDQTTTWQAVSGYLQTTDNIHLAPQGAALAGRVLADAVRPFVPVSNDMLGCSSGDLTNLLSNPMMTGTGSTAPTGWTNVGTNTISYVPRTDAVSGTWVQQAVTSTNTGGLTSNVSIGATLAIGDYVYAAIEFDCDSLEVGAPANKQGLVFTLQFYNGSTFFSTISDLYWDISYANARYPLTGGVFQTPVIQVPATTTIAQVFVQAKGGGNYRWHRAALRKVSGPGAV